MPCAAAAAAVSCCCAQEYEMENDENNAAVSRMRNALINERDQAQKAEGK